VSAADIQAAARRAAKAAAREVNAEMHKHGAPTHAYLSFNAKRDMYVYKRDDVEQFLALPAKMVLNVGDILHGYVCWVGGRPVDEVVWRLYENPTLPLTEEQLPDHGPYRKAANSSPDGWRQQITLPFKNIETGDEFLYKTGPESGLRKAREFIMALNKELATRPDDQIPVVTLGKSKFPRKDPDGKPAGDWVHIPKFTLEPTWVSAAANPMTMVRVKPGQFRAVEASTALNTNTISDIEIVGD
jgi:hypothetical protein